MDIRRLSHGCRSSLLALGCTLALLTVAGCQNDEIAVHHVPKPEKNVRLLVAMFALDEQTWFFKLEGPFDKVGEHANEFNDFVQSIRFTGKEDKPVDWTLPKDWSEEAGQGLRKKTLLIGGKDSGLTVSVTALPKAAGSIYANVNRWRNQVGLASLSLSELDECTTEEKLKDGGTLYRIDLQGPGNPLLAKRPPMGMEPPPPQVADDGSGVHFTKPPDWTRAAKNRTFAKYTFLIEDGDREPIAVTITPLTNNGGGLPEIIANVDRWCGQVGALRVKTEADLKQVGKSIKVGEDTGLYVDVSGQDPAGPRILGVMVERGQQWWFIKMQGRAAAVGEHKDQFEKFVGTVKID